MSLPARGAWIEMLHISSNPLICSRRSPHGERGLKFASMCCVATSKSSLPARGAWIEITYVSDQYDDLMRRSPHGERGLKSRSLRPCPAGSNRRSPHGERGLKYRTFQEVCCRWRSLPARGAWIEIWHKK